MMNNTNTSTPETIILYTLEDAERVLNKRRRIAINRKIRDIRFFLQQKLCGLVIIGIGIAFSLFMNGAETVNLVTFPLGISLLVTRHRILE